LSAHYTGISGHPSILELLGTEFEDLMPTDPVAIESTIAVDLGYVEHGIISAILMWETAPNFHNIISFWLLQPR
jgi:hypothetical protein